MTLEQDFSTVQRESRMWGEAHAALDRIRTALVDHQRFLRESTAEVESLRLDIESFKRIQASAEAQVERLTRQNKELLDVRDAAAEELPRVYAEAEKWERFFKLEKEATRSEHAEVERLRAALETIQELAATESLRVFHSIASDALAGIKR